MPFDVDLHCNTFKFRFWAVYTQAYGGTGAIAPEYVAAKRGHHRFFLLVREKGGFLRTLRTPLGYVPAPTRTRVNSDSCVNDGYCLRHFSVDTAPSTYFSPFPSRTLPRSTGSPWSVIHSGREGNINKQTYKTQTFVHTRSSIRQSASPCSCLCSGAPRPVSDPGAGAATFFSNRKYRYRPHTQPDVGNCWPWIEKEIVREVALGG